MAARLLGVLVLAIDRRVAVGAQGELSELPADYELRRHWDFEADSELRDHDLSTTVGLPDDRLELPWPQHSPKRPLDVLAGQAAAPEEDPRNRWLVSKTVAHSLLHVGAANEATTIPYQLFLTSTAASIEDLPDMVRGNVQRVIDLNPDILVVWFDDAKCDAYLQEHHVNLGELFRQVVHGPFKSDVCRTAWLADNGGWYVDLDVDLRMRFLDMVAPDTTFFSAWAGPQGFSMPTVLNAIIGVTSDSPIFRLAVDWLGSSQGRRGCTSTVDNPTLYCGTHALYRGLEQFYLGCGEPPPSRSSGPRTHAVCGELVRMAKEVDLADPVQRNEVSAVDPNVVELAIEGRNVTGFRGRSNAKAHFKGLDYALIYPGHPSLVLGYSRFDACGEWGCNTVKQHDDVEAEQAEQAEDDLEDGVASPLAATTPIPSSKWLWGSFTNVESEALAAEPVKPAPARSWYQMFFPSAGWEQHFSFLESHARWY